MLCTKLKFKLNISCKKKLNTVHVYHILYIKLFIFSKQIRLNETRETLHETEGNTAEIGIGIQIVEEDLAEFNEGCDKEEKILLADMVSMQCNWLGAKISTF